MASPTHVLHKLHWEISQLKKALVSEPEKLAYAHAPAYFAFNCAVAVWHLADWVGKRAGLTSGRKFCNGFAVVLHKRVGSYGADDGDRFRGYITRAPS
jgi:hypothetical protein